MAKMLDKDKMAIKLGLSFAGLLLVAHLTNIIQIPILEQYIPYVTDWSGLFKPAATVESGSVGQTPIVVQVTTVDGKFRAKNSLNDVSDEYLTADFVYIAGGQVVDTEDGVASGSFTSSFAMNYGQAGSLFTEENSSGTFYAEYTPLVANQPLITQTVPVRQSSVVSIRMLNDLSSDLSGWETTTAGATETVTSIGEGATEYFTLQMREDTSDGSYGRDGVIFCIQYDNLNGTNTTAWDETETGFPALTRYDLEDRADRDNMQKCWDSGLDSIIADDGIVEYTLKAKAADGIDITPNDGLLVKVYDRSKYLGVDGVTVKMGIGKDDSSDTDTGTTNPEINMSFS